VAVPAPTVSVELPPAVTEVGLSVAVAPAGVPLTVRLIVSAVPLVRAVEIVDVPLAPCANERLAGLALIEKSFGGGGAVTVSVTVVECVALGAVPVTVSVYVPAVAVPAPTVSVELPPAVTEVGLTVAVAPAGVPLTVRLIVSAVPLVRAVEIVDVPLAPCATERLAGLALIEKSFGGGGAVTVSVTVVECVALVAVPVTVSVYVPAAAVPAPMVSVELPPVVTEVGLSVAVAPAGVPLTVRLIVSAVPLVRAVEMVDVPLALCASERLAGLELIEKSFGGGGAVIVRDTVVVWVALVPVPVTVTVYVPAAAVPAPSVRVELLPAVTDAGLNEAVAPDGSPLALSETVCAEPLVTVVAIVDVALPFCGAETELGLALIEKSFAAQPGSLKVPIRVCQLNEPLAARYSFAYQNVHPSTGSTVIAV